MLSPLESIQIFINRYWNSAPAFLSFFNMIEINSHRIKSLPFQWESLSLKSVSGVHDSFWTHACDVDQMNQILREKFVELYNVPVLENVSLVILFPLFNPFIIVELHTFRIMCLIAEFDQNFFLTSFFFLFFFEIFGSFFSTIVLSSYCPC